MKTRSLTEGAMLTTLMVGLTYLSMYSVFVSMLIPVPLILLVVRHGLRTGVLVAVVAAFVSSLVFSSPLMAVNLLITGILGVSLGMGLREKFNFAQLLAAGVIASLVTFGLRIGVYSILFGTNLVSMGLEAMEASVGQWSSIYETFGVPDDMLVELESMTAVLTESVRMLIPLGILLSALLQTYANLFFVRLLAKRIRDIHIDVPWVPPFARWRWPWYAAWGFIVVRVLSLVPVFFPSVEEVWYTVMMNLDLFFIYLFLLQGIAIGWFFFDKYNVAKILRGVMVVLLLTGGGPFTLVVALAGMLDTWFDFRKLHGKYEVTEG